MATTLERQTTARPVDGTPRPKTSRRNLRLVLASALIVGIAAGAVLYAVVGGDSAAGSEPALSPGEVAQVRAEDYAAFLEQQWLADPMNIARVRAADYAASLEQQYLAEQQALSGPTQAARVRAEDYAKSLEQQWLADPMNIARVRAEDMARILEAQWLAQNG